MKHNFEDIASLCQSFQNLIYSEEICKYFPLILTVEELIMELHETPLIAEFLILV